QSLDPVDADEIAPHRVGRRRRVRERLDDVQAADAVAVLEALMVAVDRVGGGAPVELDDDVHLDAAAVPAPLRGVQHADAPPVLASRRHPGTLRAYGLVDRREEAQRLFLRDEALASP